MQDQVLKAEYRAMAKPTTELVWIKILLEELGFTVSRPMKLGCDKQAAIHIANSPVFHGTTKHIELDCHFIRDKVKENVIYLQYVKSVDQVADIMTKALPVLQHQILKSKLCLEALPP